MTQLLTTSNGETQLFLPSLALAFWAGASLWFVFDNWGRIRAAGWGDRRITIPLLVIALAMTVNGLVVGMGAGIEGKVGGFFMALALSSVYLASRVLGEKVLRPLLPVTLVVAASVIVMGLVKPGLYTGGLITNYQASAGYMVFGALVIRGKWQQALIALSLVALFLTGSLEAVFVVGVLAVSLLVRRDWNRNLWIAIGVVVFLAIVWVALGNLVPLYQAGRNNVVGGVLNLITGKTPLSWAAIDAATTWRLSGIATAMSSFSWIGHGLSLSTANGGMAHNIPLIIVEQIGPFAGAAWLFLTVWCAVKTKWHYAWIAIIAMGVFDHFLWTQMLPFAWLLAGVSTLPAATDLIFRKEDDGKRVGLREDQLGFPEHRATERPTS